MWVGHVWLQHNGAPAYFIIICNILNKRFVGSLSGCHLPTTLLSHKYFSTCNMECFGTSGCVWNTTVHVLIHVMYSNSWQMVMWGRGADFRATQEIFFLSSVLSLHTHTYMCVRMHTHMQTHALHSRGCNAVWVQNTRVNRDYMCMFFVDMLIGFLCKLLRTFPTCKYHHTISPYS